MTAFLSTNATFIVLSTTTSTGGGGGSGTVTGPSSSVIGDIVTWATSDGISITDSSIAFATAAQYQANTANKALTSDQVWTAATLTSITSSTSVTPDFSTGWNFTFTAKANFSLNNPTNQKVGQTGYIKIKQDGTGGRTIASWGSNFKFSGGTKPILSTGSSAIDYLYYSVGDSSEIVGNLVGGIA